MGVVFTGASSSRSYDSSTTVRNSMCGSKSPFSFTSSYDRIWIRFKSNGYNRERGFVAGYVLYKDSSRSRTYDNNITFNRDSLLEERRTFYQIKKGDKLM